MEHVSVLEAGAGLDKLAIEPPGAGHGLNLALVYEDAESRRWAREVYERVARVAGLGSLRATWWRIGDLTAPGVLAGAVSTAMHADVIVVATRATEGLPMAFYVWVDAWLPHRPKVAGALVALLGKPGEAASQSGRLREYIGAVARQGRLDFVIEERGIKNGLVV